MTIIVVIEGKSRNFFMTWYALREMFYFDDNSVHVSLVAHCFKLYTNHLVLI